jgi:hypothetical protein
LRYDGGAVAVQWRCGGGAVPLRCSGENPLLKPEASLFNRPVTETALFGSRNLKPLLKKKNILLKI